jgi:3-oxoacyl-[acyl-carrier protein] reductase
MLENKIVVVTGGARGIGAALVRGFLSRGAKVAALDLSWEPSMIWSDDRDDRFKREMEAHPDVLPLTADITNEGQVEAAYQATLERFGTVHVLVNNAAMLQRHLFPPGGAPVRILDVSNDDFRKSYEVNIFGTLNVTRRFIQPMIAQRDGSIISVISNGGITVPAGGTYGTLRPGSREQPYQSGKAAMANLMCYLADEVREYDIAVNLLMPGHTWSTGFVEFRAAKMAAWGHGGSPAMRPDHMVPVGMFLAAQRPASGNTGRIWDVPTWNKEHGYGPPEDWIVTD